MARSRAPTAASTQPGLDRTGAARMQGDAAQVEARQGQAEPGQATIAGRGDLSREEIGTGEDWAEGAVHRGRLRVRTLVTLRWMVVAGEVLLLLLVMAMGFAIPYPLCFAVVGAGA